MPNWLSFCQKMILLNFVYKKFCYGSDYGQCLGGTDIPIAVIRIFRIFS